MATTQAAATAEGKAYLFLCEDLNLKPEWLGKTFKDNGKSFTITGLNIRSKKFPVMTKQNMFFSADYVRALMTNTLEAYKKEREAKWKKQRQQELQQARRTYLEDGDMFGLKKQWLDKSFVDGRHTYTVIGLEFGRRNAKVNVRRDDGRLQWFSPPSYIVEKMTGNKKAA